MTLELKSKYSNFILVNTLKEISSDTQKSLLQTLDEQIEIGRQELEKVEEYLRRDKELNDTLSRYVIVNVI